MSSDSEETWNESFASLLSFNTLWLTYLAEKEQQVQRGSDISPLTLRYIKSLSTFVTALKVFGRTDGRLDERT